MKTLSYAIKVKCNLFANYLLNLREDVKIDVTDSRIVTTIKWLLDNQNDNGSWGNDNVAITSLMILAFFSLLKPASGWKLESIINKSIDDASTFLTKQFKKNNYENAIWDTSVAVRALIVSGTTNKQFIVERIAWLLNRNYNALNAGPHHWAQRTLALIEYGAQKQKIIESIKQIGLLLERGNYNYSPYVLSQCLEAIFRSDVEFDNSRIVNILINYIKNASLDSANFINICSSLNSLYPILNSEIENTIRISIASLFGETCFRDNGTWYHDELATAWALIALTRFSKEVVVRVPKSEIIFESKKMFDEILDETNKIIRNNIKLNLIHSLNLLVAFALLSFFITYTTIATNLYEWLKWGIPTIFVAQVTYTCQYYFRKIREAINDFRR